MTSNEETYDYIIIGAGAAGLSLAIAISESQHLSEKKVLIIDKQKKSGNDRTWCYWEDTVGAYDHLLTAQWSVLKFYSKTLEKALDIAPYKYKMLRSSDFYTYAHEIIDNNNNIVSVTDEVLDIHSETGVIVCEQASYQGKMIFSSKMPDNINFSDALYVDQHFGGWFVQYPHDVFDAEAATFMDFRIAQHDESRFLYVLPIDRRTALVEVAIFSNDHLSRSGYDQILEDYLREYYKEESYRVIDKEYGVIPMTNYPFWHHNTDKLYHIGTAGGAAKPSSGYAFKRIQNHTRALLHCLEKGTSPKTSYQIFRGKHLLYDSILLHVLMEQNIPGEEVFTDLFRNAEVTTILKFLDGESSFAQDIGVFRAPVKWPFIKGLVKVAMG